VLRDENAHTPYERLESKTMQSLLQEAVKILDHREATILRERFGLGGSSEKTLDEVGDEFGVTRERIRQIQNSALDKLRALIEDLETVRTHKPQRAVNGGRERQSRE
jgi:RNA polymerase primary sigma factor